MNSARIQLATTLTAHARYARKLRKRARKLKASGRGPDAHHNHLIASHERPERRHLCLASALLNNRTYMQAERSSRTTPNAASLARTIQPCLPREDREFAETIAQKWLERRNITLTEIRDSDLRAEKEIQARVEKIRQLERAIQESQENLRVKESIVQRYASLLEEKKTTLDEEKRHLAALQARTKPLQGPVRKIRNTVDLLEEVG